MSEIIMVKDNELENIAGGAAGTASTPRFAIGDKVMLLIYPEFGVGTVMNVYMQASMWKCVVRFDSGMIDASDIEFIPA
ncbi:hypothetical protein [Butyrivibrio sp. AE3009]|uniref:hypothetical protein n=1 Tax=Butyrivibrio sp. AE3009 TaxID=1280666 RepID=UPI0003B5EACB|nr:hypothetical protein [Butyrivibrio sp. AE3009]